MEYKKIDNVIYSTEKIDIQHKIDLLNEEKNKIQERINKISEEITSLQAL